MTKFIDKFQRMDATWYRVDGCSRYSSEFDVNHSFIYKRTMMKNELLDLIIVTSAKTMFNLP